MGFSDGSRNFKPKTGKKPFGAKTRPPRAGDAPSSTGKPYRAHKAKSFGGKNVGASDRQGKFKRAV
jgi:hypothetical protein